MPEVTVVIPTRNRVETLLRRGLRAALLQAEVDVDVVVVDDGSTDATAERVTSLGEPRVRLVRHERSRGVAAARNAGVAEARGEWVAFLDDDDVWAPAKLRLQLDTAGASGAGAVFAGVVVVDGALRPLHVSMARPDASAELVERNTIPAGSSNVVARTDLVRAAGGFDERLTYVADWDLWLALAAAGPLVACREMLVGYVRDGAGMRFTGRRAVRELRLFAAKPRRVELRADPARFLRWVAAEDRLAGRRRDAAATYLASGVAFRAPGHLLHAGATVVHADRLRRAAREDVPVTRPPADVGWLEGYRT